MRSIMSAKSPQDSSFSFSRRYFHWKKKVEDDQDQDQDHDNDEEILTFSSSSHFFNEQAQVVLPPPLRKKNSSVLSVSKLRSALTIFNKTVTNHNNSNSDNHHHHHSDLGTKVVGTLFGYRRGHVHFAFQEDTKLNPAFLIELAMPTSVLVREMASGQVRIALECERKAVVEEKKNKKKKGMKLIDEAVWRTYCNGKKCGYAMRRECGPEEWRVLKVVGPITMGAGVLPAGDGKDEVIGCDQVGELMYMRARFERVVGSKDSEAFYMINPDVSGGGPELSIYLLRV